MEIYDLIVIGGGSAGLFAGLNSNKKTILIEKNDRLGKKLLMAGAGRCNITHSGDIKDFFDHYGENYRFLKNAFSKFTNEDTIKFLKRNGMETIEDKNGKIFPKSENSKDVLKLLKDLCIKNSVKIKRSDAVESVEKRDEYFYIKTKESEYRAENIIIATGGKSYPTTGSSGDGYIFAKSFGHNIIETKPALSPVFIKDYYYADLSGQSLPKREVALYRDGKKINVHRGDIGFTHKGVSGPGILDFSRYFENGDILKINLIDKNQDEYRAYLIKYAAENGTVTVKKLLKNEDISESLTLKLLEKAGVDGSTKFAEISKKMRNRIITELCESEFVIDEVGGYNIAMVTSGGVDIKELKSKTMESKIVPNLYFVGEVVDIDGDTGGYNIQAALSMAYLAIEDINKK